MDLSSSDWEYLDERADLFVGREWVFARVRRFLSGPASTFVLCGDPGTGKTAVAARLAQASYGRIPASNHPVPPQIAEGTISAAVFCRAGAVTVLELIQRLSDQLGGSVEGFTSVLQSTLAPEINIGDVHVETGDVSAGANVTGVRVVLNGLSDERAFNQGVAVPVRQLRERGSAQSIVVLVDAVDEAATAVQINAFSRLLARLDGLHLIVTCRPDPRVLADFRGAGYHVDLVEDAPNGDDDVREYVRDRLRGRGPDGAIDTLAERIAIQAAGNFLYAFYVAGALAVSDSLTSIDQRAALGLPLPTGGLAGVYEEFLDRQIAGDETRWAADLRPVLAPLGVALGDGFTTAQLGEIASHLIKRSFSLSMARDVTRVAGQFLDGPLPDGPFRPYHQSFARFLTDPEQNPHWPIDRTETNRAVVHALSDAVPEGPLGVKDWAATDSYVKRYLATHAAMCGDLDSLLLDAGYLLAADLSRLLVVLSLASTTEGRNVAGVIRRAAQQLQVCQPEEAASYLELQARQTGLDTLADQVPRLDLARPWATPWARWRRPQQRQRLAPDEQITAMTLGDFRGEQVAVLATQAGQLQVRRLADGTNARDPFTAQGSRRLAADPRNAQITALAAGEVNSRPIVLSGDSLGRIQAWDLLDDAPEPISRSQHDGTILTLAFTEISGTPAVVSASQGRVCLWNWPDGMPIDGPYIPSNLIHALAVTRVNDVPIIAFTDDRHVGSAILPDASRTTEGRPYWGEIWDRELRIPGPDFWVTSGPEHRKDVTALAILANAGWPIVVSGDRDGNVWTWDLYEPIDIPDGGGVQIGRHEHPLRGDWGSSISATAISEVNAQQLAATGDSHGRIKVWDVTNARQIGDFPTAAPDEIHTLAVTELDDAPVIVSRARNVVRVWELNQPESADRHEITALTFADLDGAAVLLAGDLHGTVQVLHVAGGGPAAPAFRNHRGEITAIAMGSIENQPVVLSAGVDGTVQVWDPRTAAPLGNPYNDHGTAVTAVAVKQMDGRLIAASGGYDDMIRIWDVTSRIPLGNTISLGGYVPLGGVAFAELDPRPIVVTAAIKSENPSVVQAWDLLDRRPLGKAATLNDTIGAVTMLRLDSQPLVVFSDYEGVIRIRSFTDSSDNVDLHCYQPQWCRGLAATTFDGQPIVMAGGHDSGVIDIWNVRSGRQQRIEVGSAIYALATGTDSSLAVGTADGVVFIQFQDGVFA